MMGRLISNHSTKTATQEPALRLGRRGRDPRRHRLLYSACGVMGILSLLLSGCIGHCSCKLRRHHACCVPTPPIVAAPPVVKAPVRQQAVPVKSVVIQSKPVRRSTQPAADPVVKQQTTRRPKALAKRTSSGISLSYIPLLLNSDWIEAQAQAFGEQQIEQGEAALLRPLVSESLAKKTADTDPADAGALVPADDADEDAASPPERFASLPGTERDRETFLPGLYLADDHDWRRTWRLEDRESRRLQPLEPAPIILRAIPLVAEPDTFPPLAQFKETKPDEPANSVVQPGETPARGQEVNRLRHNWR